MDGAEPTGERLLALFGDETVQRILSLTDERSMSVRTLAERCNASLTTIYRRTDDLLEYQLLRVQTEVRSDGNHYKRYEANLERLDICLRDGTLDVAVERRDDAPDRFRGIWDAMQGGER